MQIPEFIYLAKFLSLWDSGTCNNFVGSAGLAVVCSLRVLVVQMMIMPVLLCLQTEGACGDVNKARASIYWPRSRHNITGCMSFKW